MPVDILHVHDLEHLTGCLATRTGASIRVPKTVTSRSVRVVRLLREDIAWQ
jgi:hypothetical protein